MDHHTHSDIPKTQKKRVAILISGRGSNMDALIKACEAETYPAQIALVVSNRAKAPGLQLAQTAGIETKVLSHKEFETREAFDAALDDLLTSHDIEIICSAGFMRLFTDEFVEAWNNALLNIHPSLLPSFKGLNVHDRVLQAGVTISGCTVHFVRAEMDSGPIILQAAVPVLPKDTPETLAERVLKSEHKIYPEALRLVASERVRIVHERVVISTPHDSILATPQELICPSIRKPDTIEAS